MSERGGGIPLGHYKSKSVSRINFLEKWESSQREFTTTVKGVAEFSWLVASPFTTWAQICLLWQWLAIVHRERCFCYSFSWNKNIFNFSHLVFMLNIFSHPQKDIHRNNWLWVSVCLMINMIIIIIIIIYSSRTNQRVLHLSTLQIFPYHNVDLQLHKKRSWSSQESREARCCATFLLHSRFPALPCPPAIKQLLLKNFLELRVKH